MSKSPSPGESFPAFRKLPRPVGEGTTYTCLTLKLSAIRARTFSWHSLPASAPCHSVTQHLCHCHIGSHAKPLPPRHVTVKTSSAALLRVTVTYTRIRVSTHAQSLKISHSPSSSDTVLLEDHTPHPQEYNSHELSHTYHMEKCHNS